MATDAAKTVKIPYRMGKKVFAALVISCLLCPGAASAKRGRVLATGDSMIQYVDTSLKERLSKRGVKVRSDARVSTGISKPFMLNWPRLARRQAHSLRPAATVVFLGANDGFPFGKTSCCGKAWIDSYAARVGAMMDSYARGGAGHVYWLTLPAARKASFQRVFKAVDAAILQAGKSRRDDVDVLDLRKVFTPRGHYQGSIRRHGRSIHVRQGDGVHLNPAGASIAAGEVARAMRADKLIR